LQQINQQLTRVEKQIDSLERQRQQRTQQESWLQNFMNFTDFAEIDWRSTELECQNLEQQLRKLEASSDHLNQLKFELTEVKQKIDSTSRKRDELIREINTLEALQKTAKVQQAQCRDKLKQASPQQLETFGTRMAVKLRQYSMVLVNIERDEADIRDWLSDKIDKEGSVLDL
jgi:uncharacterized protein YPO0396